MEAQRLQLQEAGVDTDWVTTGMYFPKGVGLLVPPAPPPAPHPPPMADTETAPTRGTGAGKVPVHLSLVMRILVGFLDSQRLGSSSFQ